MYACEGRPETPAPAPAARFSHRALLFLTAVGDDYCIDLKNVSKRYGKRVWALRDLNLRVRRGEIFGLLGSNGAGKSTLVKIMVSVVKPTRAGGTILGKPVGDRATLARIGYLPESHRFPRYLTGRQAIEFFAALSKVDRPTRKRRAAELLETVGMAQWGDRRVGEYSKGMMQRVGLAQALAGDPDLVFLDEPTDGVDPVGRREIRDVLSRLREQGKTVFVNSHLLSELELICDRMAILVAGQVARAGTLDELTAARQRYEIQFAPNASAANPNAMQRLFLKLGVEIKDQGRSALPGGQWIAATDHTIHVGTTEAAEIQSIVDALRSDGQTIIRVESVRPSLEDLFIDVVGTQTGVGAAR
jgi:ABC-2 type transport system ATP-binding protein